MKTNDGSRCVVLEYPDKTCTFLRRDDDGNAYPVADDWKATVFPSYVKAKNAADAFRHTFIRADERPPFKCRVLPATRAMLSAQDPGGDGRQRRHVERTLAGIGPTGGMAAAAARANAVGKAMTDAMAHGVRRGAKGALATARRIAAPQKGPQQRATPPAPAPSPAKRRGRVVAPALPPPPAPLPAPDSEEDSGPPTQPSGHHVTIDVTREPGAHPSGVVVTNITRWLCHPLGATVRHAWRAAVRRPEFLCVELAKCRTALESWGETMAKLTNAGDTWTRERYLHVPQYARDEVVKVLAVEPPDSVLAAVMRLVQADHPVARSEAFTDALARIGAGLTPAVVAAVGRG